jgi:hypothetical protein
VLPVVVFPKHAFMKGVQYNTGMLCSSCLNEAQMLQATEQWAWQWMLTVGYILATMLEPDALMG